MNSLQPKTIDELTEYFVNNTLESAPTSDPVVYDGEALLKEASAVDVWDVFFDDEDDDGFENMYCYKPNEKRSEKLKTVLRCTANKAVCRFRQLIR